jgi:hypothetical protein
MARLKSPAKPAAAIDDPRRVGWVASGIRLVGLQLLTDPGLRQQWSIAWRQHEQGNGPLPISIALFREATTAWPDRVAYPEIVDAWLAARDVTNTVIPVTEGATP